MTASTCSWKQYICRACGLIYDEQFGDPDSGLLPGTRFEDIPKDWECPLCGVTKADFEPYFKRESVIVASNTANVSREAGVVVIGAGIAGWSAVMAIRDVDPYIPITMISACNANRYHKPELSVAVSRGMTTDTLVKESAADAAQRLAVDVIADTFVTGISPALRQLRTTRGSFQYKKLVLAVGAKPSLPAALPASLCWRINDLAGWSGMRSALGHAKKAIAIIGAGMIGCELAEDLLRAGHSVTLIDYLPLPLIGLLPEAASRMLHESQRGMGIEYIGNERVQSIVPLADQRKLITTTSGKTVTSDVVIATTGLSTDGRIAKLAGLDFHNGIAVDASSLQTSDPDIYALGDCISLDGQACRFIEPIAKQARAIANHMAGIADIGYQHAPPIIRLKTRTLSIEIQGAPGQQGEWQTITEQADFLHMEQWFNGQNVATLHVNKQQHLNRT